MAFSRNFNDIGSEFQDIADERDIPGLAALGLTGAGGGVIAEEVKDRVMPFLNQPRNPNNMTGLAVSFAVKMVTALGLGAAAARLGGGMPANLLLVAGIGATVAAGIDIVDAVQASGFLAELPSQSQPQQLAQAHPQPTQPEPVEASGTHGREEEQRTAATAHLG